MILKLQPLLAVVFSVGLCAAFRASAAEGKPVDLQGKFEAFALNPESGDLAALDAKASTVTLFRSDFLSGKSTEKVGPVKVGAAPITPVLIAYKKYKARGVFAVVGRNDGSMYLLDAADLTLVRKVPLSVKDLIQLVPAPPADNPFIYYSFGGGLDGVLGRVNLARLVDEGPLLAALSDFTISASGTLLYGGGHSVHEARCLRVVEGAGGGGKPLLELVGIGEREGGGYVADPHENHVAVHGHVLSADLRTRLATLEFPIVAFFTKRPLMIGLAQRSTVDQSIMIASYNSFELLARVELPKALLPKRGEEDGSDDWERFGRLAYETQIFADDGRERIVAARAGQALAVPLDQFELPAEPLMLVRVEGPHRLTVGAPATLKVTSADPRVSWKLSNSPEGVKVNGQSVEWTPTAEQVGRHELQIDMSHGELTKSHVARLEVAQPHLSLPFWPGGLAASEDGKYAVAWSGRVPHPALGGAMQPEGRTTQIAVLDLAKLEVLTTATLPYRVRVAAIDGTSVYAAAEDNNYLQMFPLTDCTKRKQVVADEPITVIEPVSDQLVLAGTRSGHALRISLPDLVREPPLPGVDLRSSTDYPFFMKEDDRHFERPPLHLARLRSGWLVEGVVYGDNAAQPRLLIGPPGFFPVYDVDNDDGGGTRIGVRVGYEDDRFHSQVNHMSDGRRSVTIDHDRLPLRIKAAVAHEGGRGTADWFEHEETITLTLMDLDRGTAHDIVTLAKSQAVRERYSGDEGGPLVVPAGDGLLVAVRDKIFRYRPGMLDPQTYPAPLRFQAQQSTFAVDPKVTTTLKHVLIGAKPPVQFVSTVSRKELKIDVASGDVTVDGPGLVAAVERYFTAEPFAVSTLGNFLGHRERFGEDPEKMLQEYLDLATPRFERIVGRKPAGLPFLAPVGLRASDADNRLAELEYFVFVEVPPDQLVKKIAEHRKALSTTRAQRAAADGPGRPAAQPVAGNANDRITQLEERLKALESKLDLITRLLSEQIGKEETPRE